MQEELVDNELLSALFDAIPDRVAWLQPIFTAGRITDFRVAYSNRSLNAFYKTPPGSVTGMSLLGTLPIDEAHRLETFRECLRIYETGVESEMLYHDQRLNKYMLICRKKVLDGVLSVTRDNTTAYRTAQEIRVQASKFNSILDASADGVMVFDAIRDDEGELVDFRIAHCNTAAIKLGNLTQESIGRNLLEVLPHLRNSNQFNLHRQVLETGIPARMETTFRKPDGSEYGWFIVSLTKLQDSVISSFVDVSEKMKDQQKIAEQSELLNNIFEASISCIFACEAIRDDEGRINDFKILKVNRAFAVLNNKKVDQIEGRRYLDLFPSALENGTFNMNCMVVDTGQSVRKEVYYCGENIDGWYDVSLVKQGTNGLVVTFHDITENKKDKQIIELSERNLQEVINNSQTGIFLLNPVWNEKGGVVDFRFATVNKTLAGYAGTTVDDLRGKLHSEVFTGESSVGVLKKYIDIYEAGLNEYRFEHVVKHEPDEMWVDFHINRHQGGLLVTFLDITSIKNLQFAINKTAEKLKTVIDTSQAGVITAEPIYGNDDEIIDFRIDLVNNTVSDYITKKPQDLHGRPLGDFFTDYKLNGLFDIYKEVYTGHTQKQFDFHYFGSDLDLYVNLRCIRVGDELLVVFTDHTTLTKLKIDLQLSVDELKRSNANLEEFAYVASHDLQEPLRKIHYFAERLRKSILAKLSEEEARMFERIENASQRMSRLINDLLVYSQISRNNGAFTKIDLNEVVKQVMADLENSINVKRATIRCANLPVISGDAVQFQQLFRNLIGNSLKYCRQDVDPLITINAQYTEKDVNDISRPYHSITVADNGIGFMQEHAERIFKIFQRLHGQSEYPGTGIGLAIVQKVVENHHGSITATGVEGNGATFTIHLPLSKRTA